MSGRKSILRSMAEKYPLFRASGVVMLFLFALFVFFLKWAYEDRKSGFLPGEASPRTYFALYPMKFVDEEGTRVLRSRVGETVAGVLVRDGAAMDRLIKKIESMAKGDIGPLSLSPGLTELINSYPVQDRARILQEAARLSASFLEAETGKDSSGSSSPEKLWKEIEKLSLPMEENNIIYQILDEILQPLTRVDENMTEAVRNEMSRSLSPVERTVNPGDILAEKGQIVTPQLARVLRMQGYAQTAFPWKQILFALMAIPFWPVWIQVQSRIRPGFVQETIPWLYLSFIAGSSWVIEYISSLFHAEGMGSLFLAGFSYLTLSPAMALQVVLGGGLLGGIVVSGFSTLHLAIAVLMGIVGAFAGLYIFREVHSRSHLWRQLFFLGVLQAIAGVLIRWAFEFPLYTETVLYLLLGTALWSTLIIAILPLLENAFDVLSPLRLMELSHPSNPLLKKLQIEAPGTYYHSLMLGTLAEVVSDRIGMNSNLLKAGAYFHDIGKLRRPQFFVENQMGNANIHDSLKPSLSALIIIAHVREGLELAEEYHLPARIRQFISEHHGTTCLSYFYRKAKGQGADIPKEQFSYPGPKPRSRETGLLMLVDSVEAAVRAEMRSGADDPDLEKAIEGVVEAKMLDGQLEGIDFTLRDLAVIRSSLLYAFQSMYHTRKVKEIKEAQAASKK